MLVQKQKDLPYIAVFKVATGEEFIAKVVDETTSEFIVKNPLCLVATTSGPQFAPFLMMGKASATIEVIKPVVAKTEPDDELEHQYESVVSGIALPKKSSIIT